MQGASPADVKAQLMAAATQDVVQDDAAKADSLNGSDPSRLDISSTPNLLLYSMLNDQVRLLQYLSMYSFRQILLKANNGNSSGTHLSRVTATTGTVTV